jgi:hypothetical protein
MLKWVFGADTGPFRAGLNEMRGDVTKFSSTVKSQLAGLFGAGAIIAWTKATLDAAGRIDDLARRLDISAESFQRLAYASQLTGGNMELVGKSLTILTRSLQEAANGSKAYDAAASALNVSLEDLAKMAPEDQLITLSTAYVNSADKGAALNAIIKLLGRSGAEMVPMLVEGPERLAELMGEATIATDQQIEAMAKIGDVMDAFKMKSVAALGSVIDGFKIWAAYAEKFLNFSFNGSEIADAKFEERMDAIRGIGADSRGGAGGAEAATEAAEASLKVEQEREKLAADIAKLEEDARFRALDLTEKILDLEKRRAELAAESLFSEDESKALESRKEQLEIEKEIEGLRKQAADEQAKADDEKARVTQEYASTIAALAQESADIERRNKMAGMNDEERRDSLTGERDQALRDQRAANERGDAVGSLEAGNRAASLTGEIDAISRGMQDALRSDAESQLSALQSRGPTIATSSLAEIGGGGGARMMEQDYLKKQITLLEIIAANTAGGDQGSRPPEPI